MPIYSYRCIECGTYFSTAFPLGRAPRETACFCDGTAKRVFKAAPYHGPRAAHE